MLSRINVWCQEALLIFSWWCPLAIRSARIFKISNFVFAIFFSAAYLSMTNCINNVFYGCQKNNSELPNLTKIAQRAQAVIGSEEYYCRDGMLNSFKGINLQPDCLKKATKKVRKCTVSFHKEFSEDKASHSLCRLDFQTSVQSVNSPQILLHSSLC